MSNLGDAEYMACQIQRNAAGHAACARRFLAEGKLELATKLQRASANAAERARNMCCVIADADQWAAKFAEAES